MTFEYRGEMHISINGFQKNDALPELTAQVFISSMTANNSRQPTILNTVSIVFFHAIFCGPPFLRLHKYTPASSFFKALFRSIPADFISATIRMQIQGAEKMPLTGLHDSDFSCHVSVLFYLFFMNHLLFRIEHVN